MRRRPKPFFRAIRRLWYVQICGRQINLGPDKLRAFARYEALVDQPVGDPIRVGPDAVVALIDLFLDWCSKNRAAETYRWYKDCLQRFARRYPDLLVGELKVFHVQQWIDSYHHLSSGGKRNYCRSMDISPVVMLAFAMRCVGLLCSAVLMLIAASRRSD